MKKCRNERMKGKEAIRKDPPCNSHSGPFYVFREVITSHFLSRSLPRLSDA